VSTFNAAAVGYRMVVTFEPLDEATGTDDVTQPITEEGTNA
jgi:hypothetical protein